MKASSPLCVAVVAPLLQRILKPAALLPPVTRMVASPSLPAKQLTFLITESVATSSVGEVMPIFVALTEQPFWSVTVTVYGAPVKTLSWKFEARPVAVSDV
jgi:hypothetical protein